MRLLLVEDNARLASLIREGRGTAPIEQLIAEDRDIAILVLAASAAGEGPLITAFGHGGSGLHIPVTIIPGAMTDEELMATYALAEIFCFPSFAEGFGLPPLEAMASGVPALVSGSTALPEVCGNAAVYINPAEPASIASAADALLTDPDLYRRQQERGLERAKEFTWTRSAHAVMESINNASKKQIL